jgi:hypothetical protein
VRGEFEFSGSGTFRTGGGARIVAAMVAAVAAVVAVEWIAARIWWILGGTALLAVLVVLGLRRVIRWQERREAAYGARRPAIRQAPADSGVAATVRPAVAAPVHLHFHGLGPDDALEVARRAIEARCDGA